MRPVGWDLGGMDTPAGRTPEAQLREEQCALDKCPVQLLRDVLGLETLSGKLSI